MSVKFEIQITPRIIYSFRLYHTYTQLSGILSVIFGVVVFMFGARRAEEGNIVSAVFLFVLAVAVLVYPPVLLRIRAKRQAESSAAFSKLVCYELTDYGVIETRGRKESRYPWSDFQRAVSTNQALVLYMDKTSAVIFPRAQIGEKWAAAVEIISTHMPPDKVRIRQVN